MAWFNNLKIQVKLLLGFSLVLALTAVVSAVGVLKLNAVAQSEQEAFDTGTLGVHYSNQTARYIIGSGRDQQSALLFDDPARRADAIKSAREQMANAKQAMQDYHKTFASEQDAKDWAVVEAAVNNVITGRTALLARLEKGDAAGAEQDAAALAPAVADMNKLVDKAIADNIDISTAQVAQGADAASSARLMLIGVTVVAVLIGLGIGFYIARSLAGAAKAVVSRLVSIQDHCLASLQSGMVGLANGDLTIMVTPVTPKIEKYTKDEVGQAAASTNDILEKMVATIASYNEARASLNQIVGGVRGNAASILAASEQLRESSDEMAAATGQIATAINEVTRSAVSLSGLSQDSAREIEQVAAGSQQLAAAAESNSGSAAESKSEAVRMNEQILGVSTAAGEVAKSADESRTAALAGQQAVQQAVASMESIARAVGRAQSTVDQLGSYGQQIGDIVKAIADIASQTNLLALNAAIEAARAGEQGRGFAVVADNVRQLAERSSQSTKEIADLIAKVQTGTEEAVQAMGLGVRDVEAGREITTRAGEALESIISSVQQSAVQMQTIAIDVQSLAGGAQRIVVSAEAIASSASESASGAGEMARGTERVTEAIVQVSATSEETSASAEEVSASTEQLSAQSEELAATASHMKDLADQLTAATARFKLEGAFS